MRNLIFIKHNENSKLRFLFEVSADVDIHKGDFVMCDTKYGNAFGIADSEPFGGTNNDVAARELGVYGPLKLVKQVCSKALFDSASYHSVRQNPMPVQVIDVASSSTGAEYTNMEGMTTEMPF